VLLTWQNKNKISPGSPAIAAAQIVQDLPGPAPDNVLRVLQISSKSAQADYVNVIRGVIRVTWPILNFRARMIFLEELKLESSYLAFLAQGRLYQVLAYGWQTTLKSGVVRVTWPIFSFDIRNHIFETDEARVAKMFYTGTI